MEDQPTPSPADALLRLVSRLERLEALPRTGWIVCGVQHPESIAAHLYMVSVISLWLADRIDEPVDTARMLRIALAHDAGEAMVTDLPAPVKNALGREATARAERDAVDALFADSDDDWTDAFHDYERRSSLEARLVKAADRIQMLAKALQYHHQRRGDVRRFFDDPPHSEIPLVDTIFDELHRRFHDDDWFPADLD
jgi:putative hydrolase of HD superfamily